MKRTWSISVIFFLYLLSPQFMHATSLSTTDADVPRPPNTTAAARSPELSEESTDSSLDKSETKKSPLTQETLLDLYRSVKMNSMRSLTNQDFMDLEESCELFENIIYKAPLNSKKGYVFLEMIFGLHVGDYESFKFDVLPYWPHSLTAKGYLKRIKSNRYFLSLSTAYGGLFYKLEENIKGGKASFDNRCLAFVPRRIPKSEEVIHLDLSQNLIRFLPDMTPWRNVRTLDLDDNSLRSLDYVSDMPQLRTLRICDNKVSDLEPVRTLRHLKFLFISRNPIRNLSALRFCSQLETLEMCEMDLPKGTNWDEVTAPLIGLKKFQKLHVEGNSISDYSYLMKFNDVRVLPPGSEKEPAPLTAATPEKSSHKTQPGKNQRGSSAKTPKAQKGITLKMPLKVVMNTTESSDSSPESSGSNESVSDASYADSYNIGNAYYEGSNSFYLSGGE